MAEDESFTSNALGRTFDHADGLPVLVLWWGGIKARTKTFSKELSKAHFTALSSYVSDIKSFPWCTHKPHDALNRGALRKRDVEAA
jgi:hypothetical protein